MRPVADYTPPRDEDLQTIVDGWVWRTTNGEMFWFAWDGHWERADVTVPVSLLVSIGGEYAMLLVNGETVQAELNLKPLVEAVRLQDKHGKRMMFEHRRGYL